MGLSNITNGMTAIGSGAPTARFNVGLQLTSPVWQTVAISTVLFHIDHPESSGCDSDTFSVSFSQPDPIKVKNTLVQFDINVEPLDFQGPKTRLCRRATSR